MSTVRIPPTLRTATGGEKRVDVSGDTVREVVTALVVAHPGLEAQLLGAGRRPQPFVNAFLNDTDIRHLQGSTRPSATRHARPPAREDVVAALVVAHPSLGAQLLGQDGDLNSFVNAFLNDTDIRHLQGLDTPVNDRDTLSLLPAMAGG